MEIALKREVSFSLKPNARNALSSSDDKMRLARLWISMTIELATVGKAKSRGEPGCRPF